MDCPLRRALAVLLVCLSASSCRLCCLLWMWTPGRVCTRRNPVFLQRCRMQLWEMTSLAEIRAPLLQRLVGRVAQGLGMAVACLA